MSAATLFLQTSRCLRRIPDRFGDYARGESRRLMSTRTLNSKFLQTSVIYMTVKDRVTPQEKIDAYGLYKRAAKGTNNTEQPSAQEEIAEWEAWNKTSSLSQEEAKERYVNLINQVLTRCGRSQII